MLVNQDQWFVYLLAGGLCIMSSTGASLWAAESKSGDASASRLQLSDSGASEVSLHGGSNFSSGSSIRLLREGDSLGGAFSLPSGGGSPVSQRAGSGRARSARGMDWLGAGDQKGTVFSTTAEALGVEGFSSWLGDATGSTTERQSSSTRFAPGNRFLDRSGEFGGDRGGSVSFDSVGDASLLNDRLMRESILSKPLLGEPRSMKRQSPAGPLDRSSLLPSFGQQPRSNTRRPASLGPIEDLRLGLFELPGLSGQGSPAFSDDPTRLEMNPVTPNSADHNPRRDFDTTSTLQRPGNGGSIFRDGFSVNGANNALGRSSLSPSIMPERKINDSRDRRIDFNSFPTRRF